MPELSQEYIRKLTLSIIKEREAGEEMLATLKEQEVTDAMALAGILGNLHHLRLLQDHITRYIETEDETYVPPTLPEDE